MLSISAHVHNCYCPTVYVKIDDLITIVKLKLEVDNSLQHHSLHVNLYAYVDISL